MHSWTAFTACAFALALSLPAANAGCYTNSHVYFFNENDSNFKFGHLHSSSTNYADTDAKDVTQELSDQIDSICSLVDGSSVAPGTKFTRCEDSNWTFKTQEQQCLLIDCPGDCDGADMECIEACDDKCPWVEKDRNHVDYEMSYDGDGDDAREMTYDICTAGLHSIFDDCSDYGGDAVRDGFFFKLDPNPFKCSS